MKLAKPFLGVPDGGIYPVQYQAGDECPPELEAAAVALGAAEVESDGEDAAEREGAKVATLEPPDPNPVPNPESDHAPDPAPAAEAAPAPTSRRKK